MDKLVERIRQRLQHGEAGMMYYRGVLEQRHGLKIEGQQRQDERAIDDP